MLIIGSRALGKENPNDLDMIGTEMEIDNWVTMQGSKISKVNLRDNHHYSMFHSEGYWVEIEIAKPGNSSWDYQVIMNSFNKLTDIPTASKEIMFSIKKSHIHFPIKFHKHINDYVLLKKSLGTDVYSDITKKRFKETEERIGKKLITPKLSKSNEEFFGQSEKFVKYHFVHDDLHKIMSHQKNPIYTYMQKVETNAYCHKSMWDELPKLWKNQAVLEEAYVIALERKMIPMLFSGGKLWDSKGSFEWALMRICTTLCGGWFREWATDNYSNIINMYDNSYFDRFCESFDNGEIKRNI